MLKNFLLLICIISGFFLSKGFAQNQNLYKTSLYVKDQSLMVRDQALITTATEVLRKVSQNPNILENPTIKKLLPQASEWVSSYIYEKATSTDHLQPWLFQVTFDISSIDRIVELSRKNASSSFVVKPSEKFGPVLLWLTIKGLDQKNILVDDSESSFSTLIKTEAASKNIAIFFPLLDLQEQEKIGEDMAPYLPSGSPIYKKFISISERYEPKFIIFGKINALNKNNWQSQWRILSKNHEEFWAYSGVSFFEQIHFLTQSLENLSYPLKENLITTSLPIELTVQGINDKATYIKTLSYLKNLLGNTEISPISFKEDEVVFKLTPHKTVENIEALLKGNKYLIRVNQGNNNQLLYQLKK